MTTDRYVAYTRRFFDRWVPFYDLFSLSIAHVYRKAARLVAPQPGLRLLDVCTGTGEMALRCASLGAEVVAVDVTESMLAKARSKDRSASVRFAQMDARDLAFEDDTFDVAVVSLALHDMPRRVRTEVLRETARVTRRRVVVLDYDLPAGRLARRLAIAFVDLFESAYFRRFARDGVEPALAESGLPRATRFRVGWPFFSAFVVDLLEDGTPVADTGSRRPRV